MSGRTLALWTSAALVQATAVGCLRNDAGIGIPPQTCSTGVTVSERESALMEPGGDCISCHGQGEGPTFLFAGTVMQAVHDDTNCAGVSGVTVRITGADGRAIEIPTNANGNFYSQMKAGSIVFPYKAEVTRGGVTLQMLTPRSASETNCANCHTSAGVNGAPGRILAP